MKAFFHTSIPSLRNFVNKKVGNQKTAVIYDILFQILEFTRRSSKLKILHMVLLNILEMYGGGMAAWMVLQSLLSFKCSIIFMVILMA